MLIMAVEKDYTATPIHGIITTSQTIKMTAQKLS